jgi:hypothetical protein
MSGSGSGAGKEEKTWRWMLRSLRMDRKEAERKEAGCKEADRKKGCGDEGALRRLLMARAKR